jgi:hypothetical protein
MLTSKSLAAALVAALVCPLYVAAADTAQQGSTAASSAALAGAASSATAASSGKAAAKWKRPRTPWGDPDLQGSWPISHLMTVPLQRPAKYGDRLEFTPEELAEQRKAAETQNQGYKREESQHKLGMGHWVEETEPATQTSLIIDPANGQLPAQTPVGKDMSSKMGSDWNHEVFDSVADFGTWNRCVTRGLPEGMFPNPYNNGIEILQSPGYVAINLEMIHEARIVPLGNMPPLDGAVKQWLGSSRGHWEGNTLVVETTNFNGQTSMTDVPTRGSPRDPRASSTQMELVERFERVGKDRLNYTVTVIDPVTQVASWTARLPWKSDASYEIYEYACHEDNEAIRNYIVTSRYRRAHEPPKTAQADAGKGQGAPATPPSTPAAPAGSPQAQDSPKN